MARLLALEWDSREARLAVARHRANVVVIEHAFSVDLGPRSAGETFSVPDVGGRIAAAMAARGIGRVETLVAVGRASIELRQMSMPPSPEEELPDLVRLQAIRQFSALGDDWLFDFFPIDAGPQETCNVLAAAISPELVEQINDVCRAAGLRPQRLVLRPCAAASLLRQQGESTDRRRIRLLVDLLADEADLTVLVDQTVVFMRMVRLPGELHSTEQLQTLVQEIRRTMAAVHNQLGGRRVELLVLCGSGDEQSALKSRIENELRLPVEGFNPFGGLKLAGRLRSRLPENPERFAPLLGMLGDEAIGNSHAIDFLNPTRKPQPPGRRSRYVVAAAAAAFVLLLAVGWFQIYLHGLDQEVGRLDNILVEKEKLAQRLQERKLELEEIEHWTRGQINWLDELRRLSERFPPAEEAMLTQLKVTARNSGGGEMRLKGCVDKPKTIMAVEQALRDEQHRVAGTGGRQNDDDARYPWLFEEKVIIESSRPAGDKKQKNKTDRRRSSRNRSPGRVP